jgi:beta-lactamase class A
MPNIAELQLKTTQMLQELEGSVGLYVKFLNSNEVINYYETQQFWAASTIKVGIAATLYKQASINYNINLNKRITISEDNYVTGSGIVKLLDRKTAFTYQDLITLMLVVSDNTATNQLLDIIGWESVGEYMVELGLLNTTFNHKMMIKAGRGPNLTTPYDMGILLTKLHNSEITGAEQILSIMDEQVNRARIPKYLPKAIKIPRKMGSLPEAVHEIGIVYSKNPFIFCFFSDDQRDKIKAGDVLSKCALECFNYSEKA